MDLIGSYYPIKSIFRYIQFLFVLVWCGSHILSLNSAGAVSACKLFNLGNADSVEIALD